MRKVIVIAIREYLAAVRTRTFVLGLLMMPVLMGGSMVAQWVMRDFRDTRDKHFAVIDRSPNQQIYPVLQAAVDRHNELRLPHFVLRVIPPPNDDLAAREMRAELSEQIRRGRGLFGILEIGPDVFDGKAGGIGETPNDDDRRLIRYQSNRPTHRDFPDFISPILNRKIEEVRCQQAGLGSRFGAVREIMQPVPVVHKGLTRRNPRTGKLEDASEVSRIASAVVPGALMVLMYLVIMMGATPPMQGVVEEKMQRIAEVLLGSVQPFQLMLGKLLGMTAVSLTITTVYLAGIGWAAHYYGFSELISGALLAWFFLFQTLSSLMYGSLFIAIGAACTDVKETQNLLWPVMLVATAPIFLISSILQEPNSAVVTALSFFPFATPMLMISREAVPPGIDWWQPVLGTVLVLATTAGCVYIAGRIFRVGILMQGKGARLSDLVRWIFRG